jgi:signal transduction histidine kinase/CheY-like chemotaxis protein
MYSGNFLQRFALIVFTLAFAPLNAQDTASISRMTAQAGEFLFEYKFQESLRLSREALKQAIAINDPTLIADAYNTIAGNFEELSEIEKAIANYKKAIEYANLSGNERLKGNYNNNLANIYVFERKDFDRGLKHYNLALASAQKNADTTRMVLSRLNIAWAYFDIDKFKLGRPHFWFVASNKEKHVGEHLEAIFLMLTAMDYADRGKFDLAEVNYRKAMKSAIDNDYQQDLSYVLEKFAQFLSRRGRYKEAFQYQEQHHDLVQKIYDAAKLRRAQAEGVNLELDEYKRAYEKIETERKIQSLTLQRSRTTVTLFIVAVAVLLILLVVLYKNNSFRKHVNKELQATNEELKIARDKAEEASKLKTQFVSTISHELRTPLYGVVGITNMLVDEHKELAGSTHLNSLKFSAKYLLSLVNDILQINKIEENRLVLEKMTFNVADEINSIMNSLQFQAVRNGNGLSAEIDTDIPELVIGDKLRLSQIFMNLISNALKFTKNGDVFIQASLDRVEGNMHFIKFSIQDTGIGIAEADQSKIFEKFVQIERKQDDYQGTGLGLSIVKRLVGMFQSEIHLESKQGEGTTFTFTIGFEVDYEKTIEIINNMEVDLSSGHIFTVLVVEDNKINQMVTKKILEKHNFKCVLADDGYHALSLLEKKSFDAILMDINMPGMNGFETCRKIRQSGVNLPIIALTAFGKEEITEEAISSGMDDIIVKPFEPMQLFRIIHDQIQKVKI